MSWQRPSGSDTVYVLTPASELTVTTGKAGLLGFAGHEHIIRSRAFHGQVVYDPRVPDSSTVLVVVPAESLEVLTPPDTEEIRKVTAAMRTEVLDITQYPEIRLASRTVALHGDTARVLAALTMHGVTRDVRLVVRVVLNADTLRGVTRFVVKQTDFGIRPYRGGPGGTVRVANEVTFDIRVVAVRRDGNRH